MNNRVLIFLFLSVFSLGFAQKKKKVKPNAIVEKEKVVIFTENDAASTTEVRVIAGFLKQNPGHAKTAYFKKKLMEIIMADNSLEAKPTIKPLSEGRIEGGRLNSSKGASTISKSTDPERSLRYAGVNTTSKNTEPSEKSKRTAAALSHLFNNDPTDKEAYINIRNKSKCNLIVKISGKKYYNLDVPAKGQNFLLIDKGEYVLTTLVCDAKYSSLKKITNDIDIELDLND